jgi:hypothetical protein
LFRRLRVVGMNYSGVGYERDLSEGVETEGP